MRPPVVVGSGLLGACYGAMWAIQGRRPAGFSVSFPGALDDVRQWTVGADRYTCRGRLENGGAHEIVAELRSSMPE